MIKKIEVQNSVPKSWDNTNPIIGELYVFQKTILAQSHRAIPITEKEKADSELPVKLIEERSLVREFSTARLIHINPEEEIYIFWGHKVSSNKRHKYMFMLPTSTCVQ
jgi:hypothetical protein